MKSPSEPFAEALAAIGVSAQRSDERGPGFPHQDCDFGAMPGKVSPQLGVSEATPDDASRALARPTPLPSGFAALDPACGSAYP
jgi:hypothetical protein